MLENISKILCLHQGAELYGSDRSFLSAIHALTNTGVSLDIILPEEGELAKEIGKFRGVELFYYGKGILRKMDLRNPVTFITGILFGWMHYARVFSRYNAIYINTIVMVSALLAASLYRFSSKNIVCHVREIPSGLQLRLFRCLLRFANVTLVFNSEATKAAFRMPGEVIYNGVEEPHFTDLSGARSKKIRLLMIGRINQWKGQSFLIDAFSGLSESVREQFVIRIVGSPFEGYEYLLAELSNKLDELKLSQHIELIPFSPKPAEYYEWADFVIVPSTQPEPFGRVAIEGFSYGKPVVAASHGGLLEIVQHGENGFLFEPGNQEELGSLLAELTLIPPIKYKQMSENAHASFADKFSIAKYSEKIRGLFI